jgi:hypothetical protein
MKDNSVKKGFGQGAVLMDNPCFFRKMDPDSETKVFDDQMPPFKINLFL